MAGRYIGDNIRLLYDIIDYLKENNLPGLLVSIDFEKAFDSVNWDYMHNVLKCFNFGENIQRWIQAFYTNIRSSVVVNGKASGFFTIERGCRQGDPISPYLFILCAELLACRIRENKAIEGIQIAETEQKVSQFADDTSLFLNGDERSYETLFYELNFFEKLSGLKLNYEKTCNVWLGRTRNSDKQYLQNHKMTWNPAQFKILGLWFTNDLGGMAELNFTEKFNEVKKLFSIWSKRSSTPLGRIAVLKSLILSKLVYLWILLPNPPNNTCSIQQLQKKCFQFVWDNKNDKVKRTVAVQTIQNGGINVPHIETYIKSLKLIWMKKVLSDCQNPKWKQILQVTCPEICLLEKYGPTLLLKNNQHVNPFWKDVFKATTEFYDKTDIDTPAEFLMEPLFYNNKFKVGQSPFHFKDWSYNGIYFVKDIVHENGEFLSLQEINEKVDAHVSMLDFYGCISSVKSVLRKTNIILEDCACATLSKAYTAILMAQKGAKTFYKTLIGNPVLPNACKSWERLIDKDIVWPKVFSVTRKIQEVKLKWFQMKINYRVLVTNSILRDMGVLASNLCNFCKVERDTIYHYVWHCEHAQAFWVDFENYLRDKCHNCSRLKLNSTIVLFGYDDNIKTDAGFDHILLIAKFYVYKCRIANTRPRLPVYLQELAYAHQVDKYVHRITMRQDQYIQKWASYLGIV